jgi:uroporphyrinogen-III decarboxylase
MPDFSDLTALVQGPVPEKPLPCYYDFAPCYARLVGGIPDLTRYYFDAEEKMETQLRLKALFPEALVLPGVWADFGVVLEVSAFGGQLLWFEQGAPYIMPSMGEVSGIDRLKAPEPGKGGLMPAFLAQQQVMIRKLKARGMELDRWIMAMGPAEIAGLLLGYEKYYMALYDDPGRIRTLMELLTDFLIRWLRLQEAAIGGAQVMMIADHVCSQVRPEHLREFILPCMKAIYSAFPRAVRIYHNEGFHGDRHIETILRFGADLWHFGSDVHSLPEVYAKVGDGIVPFGGLNPHGAIRLGTPEEVRKEAGAVVEAARGRRLLLSTGTGTTPDAPLDNVRAMIEAAL